MNLERFKQEIRNLVAQDKLETAIELLTEHFADHESLDDLIIQAARYEAVKKQWEGGIINVDTYNQEINTLRRNILSFIRNISSIPVKEQPSPTLDRYEMEVAMSHARVVLGHLLLEKWDQDEVLNISTIFQQSKLRRRKLVVDFIAELENFDLIARRQKEGVISFHLNENGKSFFEKLLRVR